MRAIVHVVKRNNFVCPFLMHLARQKVQITFFSTKMTFRKEQKMCSFCGESHSSCSQKGTIFVERAFLMHLGKAKSTNYVFFLERWRSEKNKQIVLFVVRAILHVVKRNNFVSFSDAFGKAKSTNDVLFYKDDLQKGTKKNVLFVERAILHVVKRNNFVVLFWCIWQGKKYKWRSFSREMTFRKEQKKNSFCGESHSSCSQNEICLLVLFWCIWQGKKYKWRSFLQRWPSERNKKCALFVERAILHVVKRNNFVVLFWCIWQGKKYKWRSFSTKMTFRKEPNKFFFLWWEPFFM